MVATAYLVVNPFFNFYVCKSIFSSYLSSEQDRSGLLVTNNSSLFCNHFYMLSNIRIFDIQLVVERLLSSASTVSLFYKLRLLIYKLNLGLMLHWIEFPIISDICRVKTE
jgi:hypothetical protein